MKRRWFKFRVTAGTKRRSQVTENSIIKLNTPRGFSCSFICFIFGYIKSRSQNERVFWSAPRHGAINFQSLPVSRCMRALVYMASMASRNKVDVVAFHKGIQYALERLGKSKCGFERTKKLLTLERANGQIKSI